MKLRTLLRVLLLAEILLAVVAGLIDFFFPELLPTPLREYFDSVSDQDWSIFEWASAWIALAALVSLVGVWFTKNWARWLYTLTTVGYFVVAPSLSPTVMSPLADTFDEMSLMCSGGILMLSWFSSLTEEFAPNPPLNRTRATTARAG